MTQRFAYHRAVAPMMWVLVAIGGVEFVVVHFLIAMWRPAVAIVLSLVSLASIAWLILQIRLFSRLPVEIGEGRLLMRVGRMKAIDIELANVAGLRDHWDAKALKERSVLNLAMVAYPNVVVDLIEPVRVGRKRVVRAVAHRLDDPAAFVVALNGLGGAHD